MNESQPCFGLAHLSAHELHWSQLRASKQETGTTCRRLEPPAWAYVYAIAAVAYQSKNVSIPACLGTLDRWCGASTGGAFTNCRPEHHPSGVLGCAAAPHSDAITSNASGLDSADAPTYRLCCMHKFNCAAHVLAGFRVPLVELCACKVCRGFGHLGP